MYRANVQASSSSSQRRRCTLTTPSAKTPLRSALNMLWYSPQKRRLSESRGWAVIKPDDLRRGNHYCIRVSILFHGGQEGPANVWPGGAEEVAVSGNGIVKTGRHAQSHHPKRRGINAHAATVRRQVCHHWPTLLPDGTDPNVWQQANADLHRSLLDLRGACSRAERVPLALGELR